MIKDKIINHLIINGKKETSEKILKESVKKIQKESKKQLKKIMQLAIINSTPIFKVHKISNKRQKKKKIKEIPAFISKTKSRISLAIKLILLTIKKKSIKIAIKIKQELLQNYLNEGSAIQNKNELQKKVLLNKRYFNYYRW